MGPFFVKFTFVNLLSSQAASLTVKEFKFYFGGSMKSLFFVTIFATLSTFASAAEASKYVCQEYDLETEKVMSATVVIESTGDTLPGFHEVDELQFEANKTPATMTVKENGLRPFSTSTYIDGFVYEEDVNYLFKSEDGKTTFMLYLDETEQAYLELDGSEDSRIFFCN